MSWSVQLSGQFQPYDADVNRLVEEAYRRKEKEVQEREAALQRQRREERLRDPNVAAGELALRKREEWESAARWRAAEHARDVKARDAQEEAVAAEDYEAAKRLKLAEETLRRYGGQLAQLEAAKRQAVDAEDYEAMLEQRASDANVANLERQLTQQKEGSRRFVEIMKGITAYKEGWISRRRRRRRRR